MRNLSKILFAAALPLFFSFDLFAQQVPTPGHVVVVVMENHAYSQIIGSANAPYINSLANDPYGALFTQSYGVTHPSQPNYLYLFSGASQNVILDFTPFSFLLPFTTANLGAGLLQHSRTFTGYSEDLPSVGYTGDNSGQYYRKHNPWVNWQGTGTNGIPSSLNQPFTSFPTNFNNLPTVSFVVPNQDHDMHDGTIAQADTWLQSNLNNYIQWAKANNSLLILTFDEDDDSQNNRIATIFIGQMVKSGQYTEHIDHNNVLRTMEDMYGLTYAGGSSTATPITDCWVYRPVSAMSANPLSICPGQSVNLTDMSTNVPTAWSWTFPGGNPGSSSSQNPTVRYDSAGVYPITLVSSNHMGSDSLTVPGYITVHPNPSITLSLNAVTICAGDTIGLSAYGASVYSWLPAPDIITVNGNRITAAPGSNISYKVTGSANGCSADTAQTDVSVQPAVIPGLTISADTGTAVCSGTTVGFTASQVNGGTSPVYQWTIDGIPTGSNLAALSAQAINNNFSVACKITSNENCARPVTANSNVIQIMVNPLPVITASPDMQTVCEGNSITLTADGADHLNWSPVTALDTSAGTTVVSTPSSAITYVVTGIDSNGCTSQASAVHVLFSALPHPAITASDSLLSTGPASSCQWFLDGSAIPGAELQNFVASVSGLYQVETFNADGCAGWSDTLRVSLSSTGVNELGFSLSSGIFPNPNKGRFVLSCPGIVQGEYCFRLYDLTGRLNYHCIIYPEKGTKEIELNTGINANGLYLFEISLYEKKQVIKVFMD